MQAPVPPLSFNSPPSVRIPAPSRQGKFEATSIQLVSPTTALELLAEQATQHKWWGPGGFNLLDDDGDLPNTSGFTFNHELPHDPTTSAPPPFLAPKSYSIPVQHASSKQPSPPAARVATIEPRRNLASQAHDNDPPSFNLTPRATVGPPSPELREASQPVDPGISIPHLQVGHGAGDREAPCERLMSEPESRKPVPPVRRSNSSEKPPTPSDFKRGFYRCDWEGCNKEFKKPCLLKSHYCIHTKERPFPCALCSMSFIRGHDLKRHQRSVHSMGGRASVSCQNCGKTFTRLDSCKYHEATSCAAMLQKDT